MRRQTQAREKWLADHPEAHLDASLVMTDAGRSAYRRKDWDTYALARFVEHIKAGRVEKGSYLLVENLDRLSREEAGEAVELFLSIVNKGIVIVQLSPAVLEFKKPVDAMQLMFAIVELSRGHSESAVKSERMAASWARKHKEATTKLVTRRLPGWIKLEDGKPVLDSAGGAAVRRMFAMALAGHGVAAIAKTLNAENVPVLGRTTVAARGQAHLPPAERRQRRVTWSATLVWHILTTRATIGEYVPYRRRSDRGPGTPVPDYYPAVVDADTYHAARAAIAERGRVGRGRRGKHVNLFAGLVRDWRDDGSLSYWRNGPHPAVLISVNAKEGRKLPWVSFPADTFDLAILSQLAEVPATEVWEGSGVRAAETLAGELAALDALEKLWVAKMDNPAIVDTVAAKLEEFGARRKELKAKLEDARRQAANPVTAAWEDARVLMALASSDRSDETRLRLRTALRRAIESVTCRFLRAGRDRIAFVRVKFAGRDAVRMYVVYHRPVTAHAKGRRTPGRWWCRSFAARDAWIRGPIVDDPTFAPDEKLRERLRRHAAGEDGRWRCTNPNPITDQVGEEFGNKPIPPSPCRHSWTPGRDKELPRRCPACGRAGVAPVIPDNVTTGEVP